MRKGFTMIEIIFVITILGILGGIAIPKMSSSVDIANTLSNKEILYSVRMGITTERQKRILKGDFTDITSLNNKEYVFDIFSPDKMGERRRVLENPVKACEEINCWSVKGSEYIFHYGKEDNETCVFKLVKNRLVGECDIL
jgi:general secretion pathway protein G